MGKNAISQDVRAWFAAHPSEVPPGAETSVQKSCKGRIAQSAIKVFNAKSGMKYNEGNEPMEVISFRHPATQRVRKVEVPRSEARKLAGAYAGKRGFLSTTAKARAGERYAKSL